MHVLSWHAGRGELAGPLCLQAPTPNPLKALNQKIDLRPVQPTLGGEGLHIYPFYPSNEDSHQHIRNRTDEVNKSDINWKS